MDVFFDQWLAAIRALTATTDEARRYLDRRLQFTTEVARALSHDDAALDSLAYGVTLEGHASPVYIGQTTEGRRRLWDLPIGESHHLANSFPPETWERVVVVYWGQLLERTPELASSLAAAIRPKLEAETGDERQAIGLGLEYRLQCEFRPLFNRRKKKRDGSWRDVDWQNSASLGARVGPLLGELYSSVIEVWRQLTTLSPEGPVGNVPGGRVVFPIRIREGLTPTV
jgi:hypothetical protein